jgi:hypothetical protein
MRKKVGVKLDVHPGCSAVPKRLEKKVEKKE